MRRATGILLLLLLAPAARSDTSLRFEVRVAPALLPQPRNGRLLIVLARNASPEPRLTIGRTGLNAPPVLAVDADGIASGGSVVVDQNAEIFPLRQLSDLPAGDYYAQAVFDTSVELKLVDAPGNLYSDVRRVTLNPTVGATMTLELNHQLPAEQLPTQSQYVRYVKLQSRLLSEFHGRPAYLRAGIILPRDFDREPNRRYPLRVHIGGYGTRFTAVERMMSASSPFRRRWLADDTPRMILLHLDGAGPYGDPYQVNSANNGPYGDAITQELIPYIEQQFRGIGRPSARVLDGASTGGWVSLALQVFYPDYFNGCWSQCPDPVDFRAYELIDIYRDDNAYVNGHGFERPAMRDVNGDVRYTVRHECQIENVLGRGSRWTLSGKDWCAWNATFGPRGADGLPKPLWEPKTGKIDRSVVAHWRQYDLRLLLEQNWKSLAPRLNGKIHIWVGDADNYYLNNAVHLLDASLRGVSPPFVGRIEYGPGQGHTSGWSEQQVMREMAAAVGR
jgi:Putative esterase